MRASNGFRREYKKEKKCPPEAHKENAYQAIRIGAPNNATQNERLKPHNKKSAESTTAIIREKKKHHKGNTRIKNKKKSQ